MRGTRYKGIPGDKEASTIKEASTSKKESTIGSKEADSTATSANPHEPAAVVAAGTVKHHKPVAAATINPSERAAVATINTSDLVTAATADFSKPIVAEKAITLNFEKVSESQLKVAPKEILFLLPSILRSGCVGSGEVNNK